MGYDVFADPDLKVPYFRDIPSTGKEKVKYLQDLIPTFQASDKVFRDLRIAPEVASQAALPPGAWMAQIRFTLRRNLFSRDEVSLYPTDNPMLRDPFTKRPMIAGSTWKGCLRAAAYEFLLRQSTENHKAGRNGETVAAERLAIWRLFGNEKGKKVEEDEEEGAIARGNIQAYLNRTLGMDARKRFSSLKEESLVATGEEHLTRGRLHCLPSYPDKVALDVFNPRNPQTQAGSIPIHYEVVPEGTPVTLTLLYFPFDILDAPKEVLDKERKSDWERTRGYCDHLLRYCGVGAKKTLGFGTAAGTLSWKFSEPQWMEQESASSGQGEPDD